MTYKRKKPIYISLECSVLMSHLSRMMSYEERGRWITEFAFHLVNGDGENEYARELLKEASERLEEAARKKAEYREKKKSEEEERKAARSAARKSKDAVTSDVSAAVERRAYGSMKNVLLSAEECSKLKNYEYDNVRPSTQDWNNLIEELSVWKSKGNRTKSDYSTLLSWFQRRVKEDKKEKENNQKSFQQMECERQDSLFEDVYRLKGIIK